MVREEGDTRLHSQISQINPGDQWGDRCRSQITLTPNVGRIGRTVTSGGSTTYQLCDLRQVTASSLRSSISQVKIVYILLTSLGF